MVICTKREYSAASLWSTVGGKVVIPEAIAKYLESFGTFTRREHKGGAIQCIAQVGFGHYPEDSSGNIWKFSEDNSKNLEYRSMFSTSSHKFDIIRAVLDGYLIHSPKVAVRFGTKFAKTLESETDYWLSPSQLMTYQEDAYGGKRSYTLTLSDYPEPWNYKDALRLQEDFGGEIVKYG